MQRSTLTVLVKPMLAVGLPLLDMLLQNGRSQGGFIHCYCCCILLLMQVVEIEIDRPEGGNAAKQVSYGGLLNYCCCFLLLLLLHGQDLPENP
jgi:hypothetical protein